MNLSFNGTGKIDGIPTCHKLFFRNVGATTVYWGFEPETSAGDDANQGIPLTPGSSEPGEGIAMDGNDNISRPIFFACTGDASVNFTRMT